jgi:hypothetical protein
MCQRWVTPNGSPTLVPARETRIADLKMPHLMPHPPKETAHDHDRRSDPTPRGRNPVAGRAMR